MRSVVGGLAVFLVHFACSEEAPPPPSKNRLLLELGGNHASLQQALQALDERAAPEQEEVVQQPVIPPSAPPSPEPVTERWAELGESQTISELTQIHLGTSRRWQEVLELNGWTEEQARRLRAGTRVKLPPQ